MNPITIIMLALILAATYHYAGVWIATMTLLMFIVATIIDGLRR